jgi:hypothetical protein
MVTIKSKKKLKKLKKILQKVTFPRLVHPFVYMAYSNNSQSIAVNSAISQRV